MVHCCEDQQGQVVGTVAQNESKPRKHLIGVDSPNVTVALTEFFVEPDPCLVIVDEGPHDTCMQGQGYSTISNTPLTPETRYRISHAHPNWQTESVLRPEYSIIYRHR